MRQTAAAYRIREAELGDYEAYARLFPELGPEFPVPDEAVWRGRAVAETLVAEAGGEVIGYVLGAPFGERGHVSQLVVEPSHRRSGIGRELLAAMGERFRALGCTTWQLNVKRENTAAYELYLAAGFSYESTCSWIRLQPAAIAALPFGRYEVLPLEPAEDPEFERRFEQRQGLFAWSRSQPGASIHAVLGAGGARIGFGTWVAPTRFVARMRLRHVDALAPLLASLPEVSEHGASVAVEAHDELREAALRCGGTLTLETDHLVAPLPGATPAA